MNHEAFASKIAYVCIFSITTRDAAENLVRLITKHECGFDEGTSVWQAILMSYIDSPDELLGLNRFGARFTTEQWREIIGEVTAALGLTRN